MKSHNHSALNKNLTPTLRTDNPGWKVQMSSESFRTDRSSVSMLDCYFFTDVVKHFHQFFDVNVKS